MSGASTKQDFDNMRFLVSAELKKLGYDESQVKDELLQWNGRCKNRLPPSERKNGILKYVDWVFKNDCIFSCNANRLKDYCLGKDNCEYYIKTSCQKREEVKELPFDMLELEKYLTSVYGQKSYLLIIVVKTLRKIQMEEVTGEIIIKGFRTIASEIRDDYNHILEPIEVSRLVNTLIEEKVIEKPIRGKSGTFHRMANGYRFLAWRPDKHP